MNEAVELIGQFQRELDEKKDGRFSFEGKTSDQVPFTALTSNQFAEGMKKIFELEPLIKLRAAQDKKAIQREEVCLKVI